MLLLTLPDGSVTDKKGRVVFYSADRFLNDIVEQNRCFVCGTAREHSEFNDEHVIPDWLLRRHNLHDKRIIIPGGSELTYGRYKIPCCWDCNRLLGKAFEEPISAAFANGYTAVMRLMVENPRVLFGWMNLIFLKTHLKDRSLLLNRDRRIRSARISDIYEWPEMHHVHCVARTPFTGAGLSAKALGSVIVLRATTESILGAFDYADYFPGRALMLRSKEIMMICVMNDSCGVLNLLSSDLERITGPLAPLQCRELLAHASYANSLIKKRPKFHTVLDQRNQKLTISANVPRTIDANQFHAVEFGHVLYSLVHGSFRGFFGENEAHIFEHMQQGRWTFLFDQNRKFISG